MYNNEKQKRAEKLHEKRGKEDHKAAVASEKMRAKEESLRAKPATSLMGPDTP